MTEQKAPDRIMPYEDIKQEYWPRTPEGRALCLLLAIYGVALFGYVTATLATFFIGRDAEDDAAEIAGAKAISALHAEIDIIRNLIRKARGEE